MKILLRYCLIFFSFGLFAFVSLDDVVKAIKDGNASELSKYFDNTIEITFPDKSNAYSKSQAELVVKDFFNNNIVTNFEITNKGDNAGVQFVTGTLQTKNGDYKTSIYLKQKGDKQLLQELRFEK
ncbi:MAG: DUF4783 domain-containing protein [Bacteroidota bacterium]|nr:DUF4783 domain-containing protein [Bacteroidota bacterium]